MARSVTARVGRVIRSCNERAATAISGNESRAIRRGGRLSRGPALRLRRGALRSPGLLVHTRARLTVTHADADEPGTGDALRPGKLRTGEAGARNPAAAVFGTRRGARIRDHQDRPWFRGAAADLPGCPAAPMCAECSGSVRFRRADQRAIATVPGVVARRCRRATTFTHLVDRPRYTPHAGQAWCAGVGAPQAGHRVSCGAATFAFHRARCLRTRARDFFRNMELDIGILSARRSRSVGGRLRRIPAHFGADDRQACSGCTGTGSAQREFQECGSTRACRDGPAAPRQGAERSSGRLRGRRAHWCHGANDNSAARARTSGFSRGDAESQSTSRTDCSNWSTCAIASLRACSASPSMIACSIRTCSPVWSASGSRSRNRYQMRSERLK